MPNQYLDQNHTVNKGTIQALLFQNHSFITLVKNALTLFLLCELSNVAAMRGQECQNRRMISDIH